MLNSAQTSAQEHEGFEGFTTGIRANAVKGDVFYWREKVKFHLEPGLRLEEGDLIETRANSYAELLLQPGNYLRIGGESELQIVSARHDRMRLKLSHGSIAIEIVGREGESSWSFYESLSQRYELIRFLTPNAEIFVTQPGIFRLNAITASHTDVIVRKGEAVLNGLQLKEKRRGIAMPDGVSVREIDPKVEDAFDLWSSERAEKTVQSNRMLKKDAVWSKKRKEEKQPSIKLSDDEEKRDSHPFVVSAKPGAVNFVEPGVEFNRPEKERQPLTEKSQLEAGDSLRTDEDSYAEVTVLPDMYLRVNRGSELLLEELTNEEISLTLLRGSMILDIARFDRKQVPRIALRGGSTSVVIADAGNYRVDVGPDGDQIMVREGKVLYNERSVGSCRRIFSGSVVECNKKRNDNFDFWSMHRGEGEFFTGRRVMAMATYLVRLRRNRSKNKGFWFQNPGQTHYYTFVPYYSPNFRSPYGGKYSTVLVPPRIQYLRLGASGGQLPARPRPQIARP
jgi:hypothetical protein